MDAHAKLRAASEALKSASQHLRKCQDDLEEALKSTTFGVCNGSDVYHSRTFDPLGVLPDELKLRILKYLPFRTMVGTRRVSKKWRTFIDNTPDLWLELELCDSEITHDFIQLAMEASCYRIKALTLSCCAEPGRALGALVVTCPLENIRLQTLDWLELEEDEAVISILHRAKNIERIRFGQVSVEDSGITMSFLRLYRDQLEEIQFDEGGPIADFDVTAQEPITRIRFPVLRTLSLTIWRDTDFTSRTNGGPDGVSAKFPALKSLKLHTDRSQALERVSKLDLRSFLKLESLDLSWDEDEDLEEGGLDMRQITLFLPTQLRALKLSHRSQNVLHHLCLPMLETIEMPFWYPNELTTSLLSDDHEPSPGKSPLKKLIIRDLIVNNYNDVVTFQNLFDHPRLNDLEELGIIGMEGEACCYVDFSVKHMQELSTINLSGSKINEDLLLSALRAPALKCIHPGRMIAASLGPLSKAKKRGVKILPEVPDNLC